MLLRVVDPEEESLETSLDEYICLKVFLKDASIAIEKLNLHFPLENCRHLKRIRRIKTENYVLALLCKNKEQTNSSDSYLTELAQDLIPYQESFLVRVPSRQPITRKQYEAWNLIWPVVFHESMDEKHKLKQLSDHSILFTKYKDYFLENYLSLLIIESIYSADFDEEHIIYRSSNAKNTCEIIEHVYPFDHLVIDTLQHPEINKRIVRNGKIPYLLSGCIALVNTEPCILCSMALLHSRIDAIIYFYENNVAGSLGSKCYLHSIESLNHNFPVYRVKVDTNKASS